MAKQNGVLTEGLSYVERLTATYAEKRIALMEKMSYLDADVVEIKRKQISGIRRAAAAARDAKAELTDAIDSNKVEFDDPRTRVFHGIKVGFRKLVGKLTWDDDDLTVKLIKKHFPDSVDVLIKTTEKPIKKAIENLSANDLKRIGCEIGDDGDEVVVSASDTDIDKIVDALLKDTADINE